MHECRTCDLIERRDADLAPPWDSIRRTQSWDIVHCYGTSVEGWIVLVLRRHVAAIAELTDAEADGLGPLVVQVSRALRDITGCAKTYVAQFAEAEFHRHVHVHVIPRSLDLPEDQQGPNIFKRLGVPEAECVSEHRMNGIAKALRPFLSD